MKKTVLIGLCAVSFIFMASCGGNASADTKTGTGVATVADVLNDEIAKEDGTSSDTIKKIYQRKRNSYKTALNRKKKKNIPT